MIRQKVVGCRVLGIRFQNACLLLNSVPGELLGTFQFASCAINALATLLTHAAYVRR